jgi:hypothetical protein
MQALIALVPALTGAAGGASALSAGIGLASAAVSGIASINENRYKAAVLSQQARTETENATRIRMAGQVQAQQQDQSALEQIGGEIANFGASGFDLTSGSFVGRTNKLRRMASVDRQRIVEDANLQARSSDNAAASALAGAKQAKKSAFLSFLSAGIGAAGSLVDSANLVDRVKASRITDNSRKVSYG